MKFVTVGTGNGLGSDVAGASGSGNPSRTVSRIASADLSALRVVRVQVGEWVYADAADAESAYGSLALLDVALVLGASGSAIAEGDASDNSWNWSLNLPIWLGSNGTLIQVPAVSGYDRIVAYPVTPTQLYFDPGEAIEL